MRIFEYYRDVPTFVGKKFLVLSDLHIFKENSLGKLCTIKEYIEENAGDSSYDAIFVVGDIVDATNVLRFNNFVSNELLNFMKFLGEVAPTYICYGSHDLAFMDKEDGLLDWYPDEQIFQERFLDKVYGFSGIQNLDNGTQDIGDGYTVSVYNPPLVYAMDSPDGDNKYLIEEQFSFLNNLTQDKVNTLLCHYPNAIKYLHRKGKLNNVDLAIAGHNHNGITQFIPLECFLNLIGMKNCGLITPGKVLFPRDVRGVEPLSYRTDLLINPAVTSLAECTGNLAKFDSLFYVGATEVIYEPCMELKKVKMN